MTHNASDCTVTFGRYPRHDSVMGPFLDGAGSVVDIGGSGFVGVVRPMPYVGFDTDTQELASDFVHALDYVAFEHPATKRFLRGWR